MRVLLDTQAWLWAQAAPERFNTRALDLVRDGSVELLLSAVSSWEIAIKVGLGRLRLPEPPPRYVPSRMAGSGTRSLPIEHSHALRVAELPPHHDDPFDRLLVAQAQVESLPILTSDRLLDAYDVEILRAD